MYASSADELEAATEALELMPHKGYVARVKLFPERKAKWVLLFRLDLTTRGHKTNNFAEASIRILKDVILRRYKAHNAVALVDLVTDTWETCFRDKLTDHANNRVPAHQLCYSKLLQKKLATAAKNIRALGNYVYEVPSATCLEY